VYPALHRLERAGTAAATWWQDGRRRRIYRLTPAGRNALDTERSTWRDFSAAVSALLQPAPTAVNPT
jgi:PadR family transcriptional regulator